MKIKLLGTRGEVKPTAPYHSKHSGVLIDDKILLDLGEKDFLGYQPSNIFITHLHPDHAFFITAKEPVEIRIPVYAPEKHKNLKNIHLISGKVAIGPYTLTPIPTHHSKKVRSVAYLVEKGGERLLYTGDLIWIDKKYHPRFKDLDLVITEGSYLRKGGLVFRDKETGQIFGHTGIPDLVRLFSKFTRKILLIHFGSWFYRDIKESRKKLQKVANEQPADVQVGYDGMELEVLRSSRSSSHFRAKGNPRQKIILGRSLWSAGGGSRPKFQSASFSPTGRVFL